MELPQVVVTLIDHLLLQALLALVIAWVSWMMPPLNLHHHKDKLHKLHNSNKEVKRKKR